MGKKTVEERRRDFAADQMPYQTQYRKLTEQHDFKDALGRLTDSWRAMIRAGEQAYKLNLELSPYALDAGTRDTQDPRFRDLFQRWGESLVSYADARRAYETIRREVHEGWGQLILGGSPEGALADMNLSDFNALMVDRPIFEDQLPVQPILRQPNKYIDDFKSMYLFGGKILILKVNPFHTVSAIQEGIREWVKWAKDALNHKGKKRVNVNSMRFRNAVQELSLQGLTQSAIARKCLPELYAENPKRALQHVKDAKRAVRRKPR